MDFQQVTPAIFASLQAQLVKMHQAVVKALPTVNGIETGNITIGNEQGTYTFDPSKLALVINVTKGGNFLKNAVMHHQIHDAIAALGKTPVTNNPPAP